MVTLQAYPVPQPGVVGRILESDQPLQTEAVLVLTLQGKVKVLNEVGARIWTLANGQRTVQEIAALICREYAVEVAQAEMDVLEFVADLAGRGVFAISDQPVEAITG